MGIDQVIFSGLCPKWLLTKYSDMQTLKLYLYDNIIDVQIMDLSIFTVRNRIMYNRNVKVYQGIDNPIQLNIKNQDQKAVNLTGYNVSAQIQDPVEKITVESFACTWVNQAQGQGYITLTRATVDNLEQRNYVLTFRVTQVSDNTDEVLYADDNHQVPIGLEILPGYYSELAASGDSGGIIDGGPI
jgi:hypothetical protein